MGEKREGRAGGRRVRGLRGNIDDGDQVGFVGQRVAREWHAAVPVGVAGFSRELVSDVAPGGEELLAGPGVLGLVDVGEHHFVEFAREAQEVLLVPLDLRLRLADLTVAVELVFGAADDGGPHAHVASRDDFEADRRRDAQ